MGNCRSAPKTKTKTKTSKPSSTTPATANDYETPFPTTTNPVVDEKTSSSTAALIKAILPVVLPIVRHVASLQLVKDKMILRDEELLEEVDEENLPLGPIDFTLDHINVVDCQTLCKDQECMPEFAWPEQERITKTAKESSSSTTSKTRDDNNLLVLDILGFLMRINLAPGVEFTVPVEGPLGLAVNLEIGTGGKVKHAWIQVEIPKLRIWYVNETRMAYVAFLERPKLVPHLHANADRGKGDFFEMEFASGGGGLDDVVESILCGFGPSSVMRPEKQNSDEKPNWVADVSSVVVATKPSILSVWI
jgi:hypothetical protein